MWYVEFWDNVEDRWTSAGNFLDRREALVYARTYKAAGYVTRLVKGGRVFYAV
jgi:hypothetical protein